MIAEIYSKNGKIIPLKNGIIVYPDSMIRFTNGEFSKVLNKKMLRIKKGAYNDISQSRNYPTIELLDI